MNMVTEADVARIQEIIRLNGLEGEDFLPGNTARTPPALPSSRPPRVEESNTADDYVANHKTSHNKQRQQRPHNNEHIQRGSFLRAGAVLHSGTGRHVRWGTVVPRGKQDRNGGQFDAW